MTALIFTLRLSVIAAGAYLLAGVATPAVAQTPGTGGPTPAPTPTDVPIDGGASLLLAAGAAYGLKRLRSARHPRAK